MYLAILLDEYLRSDYELDCDYVDGSLVERHAGTQLHSLVMGAVGYLFHIHLKDWRLRSFIVIRIQTAATRIRVADVAVVPSGLPMEGIVRTAPLLCIEVLSPEDRFQQVVIRAQEYLRMGVPHVWIIEPESRECWTLSSSGGAVPMMEDAFTIPGTPVRVAIADIFEEIDSAPKA